MRLTSHQVDIMAFEIARDLVRSGAVHADEDKLAALVLAAATDDLQVEDRLEEEVRQHLKGYEQYMRTNNIAYSEMFDRIKKKLVTERKLIL